MTSSRAVKWPVYAKEFHFYWLVMLIICFVVENHTLLVEVSIYNRFATDKTHIFIKRALSTDSPIHLLIYTDSYTNSYTVPDSHRELVSLYTAAALWIWHDVSLRMKVTLLLYHTDMRILLKLLALHYWQTVGLLFVSHIFRS